ncbi:Hypothetical_protein [Hexamita inflata]|uniref:Hypothetical_protein n=1 Tax=Hexamita inflata TaxID=28002 RepID=A0AA86NHS1_9EUKA|nr:Hypothetical protein HINF_LOCUS7525 [Hexamita inflata]
MKYLQFNRETEQTSPRVVRLAFTSRLAHQTPPRRRPQSSRRPETDDEARHSGRPGNAEELLVRSYYQFNTASYSKLRSEVWSGNLKYRAGRLRGNRLCRTFSFSRGTCFSPSRQRGVPGRACSFPQRRAVGRRRGPESEERRAIRPWQKARGNELVWCSQQMSEHRASPSSLAEQAATDSDILCALVKQNKYNIAYNDYQCRNLESVTTIQVIFVQISIQHCCSCWNRPSK